MNCPENLVKYLMCIVNGLFVLLGIVLFSLGALTLTRTSLYNEFVHDGFYSIPALLMFIGVFVTILFFFGCCGLKRQSYWMVMTFAVLLGVMLLLELIGGISAYMLRENTELALNKTLHDSFQKLNNSANQESEMWNRVQSDLQCCGVESYTDFKGINQTVPNSCCKTDKPGIPLQCDTANLTLINQNGCEEKIKNLLSTYIGDIAKWAIAVAFVHLLWIIGTCYFAIRFRRMDYETV